MAKRLQTMLVGSFLLLIFSISSHALAGVHFSLSGSASNNNLGLQTQSSFTGSASIAFDMGSYIRIGMTHSQALSDQKGFSEEEEDVYVYSQTKTNVAANSLDLTFILYYGQIFLPYVKIGYVEKNYIITYTQEDSNPIITRAKVPSPSAGLGVGIQLSKQFSLKLSHNLSLGVKLKDPKDPNSDPVQTFDTNSSIGISYKI